MGLNEIAPGWFNQHIAAERGEHRKPQDPPFHTKDGAPSASLYFLNNSLSVFLPAAAMSKSSPFLRPGRRPSLEWKQAKRDSSSEERSMENRTSTAPPGKTICYSFFLLMARLKPCPPFGESDACELG